MYAIIYYYKWKKAINSNQPKIYASPNGFIFTFSSLEMADKKAFEIEKENPDRECVVISLSSVNEDYDDGGKSDMNYEQIEEKFF